MNPLTAPTWGAIVGGFFAAAIRVSTPLLLAALGETVSERGGVINLGLEGAMLTGALAAAIGAAAGGPWLGAFAAILTGTVLSGALAILAIWIGANQIVAGTALSLGAVGITGAIYRQTFGSAGVGLALPTFGLVHLPLLNRIPVFGPALEQPALVYIGYLLVPLFWLLLFRSRWGLALRAVGEAPDAAVASGVQVRWVQTSGVLIGGAMGGLAGGALVLAQVGTFAERMTAGRGYVAIAIVVLGRWHPAGVALVAALFGGLTALQYLLQATGVDVPYQVFLILPYLLTLLALAGVRGRAIPPAALAKSSV